VISDTIRANQNDRFGIVWLIEKLAYVHRPTYVSRLLSMHSISIVRDVRGLQLATSELQYSNLDSLATRLRTYGSRDTDHCSEKTRSLLYSSAQLIACRNCLVQTTPSLYSVYPIPAPHATGNHQPPNRHPTTPNPSPYPPDQSPQTDAPDTPHSYSSPSYSPSPKHSNQYCKSCQPTSSLASSKPSP
jgi:hypothetical protein